MSNLRVLADLATTITAAAALFGVWTYRGAMRTRRAEWLASLHESFFETNRYAHIRRVLDYRLQPMYADLVAAVTAGRSDPLVDELYRYLNFFEFLASLKDLKQITDSEIYALFDYDLRHLKSHEFIVKSLLDQGFEKLSELLDHLPPQPART